VDSHFGVALGVDMAPLRELPNTAAFFGLAGALVMVILALFFIKHEIEAHDTVDNSPNPARRVTVRL
jgi:hypothetical protein